jgi:hypothetical protein
MKITNFNTGFNSSNQYGKPVRGSEPVSNQTPVFKKASGGEDFIEISREAVMKHREGKILNFTEALIKKEAAKSENGAENQTDSKTKKNSYIMETIRTDRYNFDDESALSETAERLLAFLVMDN